MSCCCDPAAAPGEPVNQYAVVSYIPDPFGEFITLLRTELVEGCVARSHVTILPPRPLMASPEEARRQLKRETPNFSAFELEIGDIAIFEQTSVIYAEIRAGRQELEEMHAALNTGALFQQEPYRYHPHVTLAQGFDPVTLRERLELARRRWEECRMRRVMIENLIFVQNTSNNRWLDLVEFELRPSLAVATR